MWLNTLQDSIPWTVTHFSAHHSWRAVTLYALFLVFPYFIISVPAARLSWPYCQLLSTQIYRIVVQLSLSLTNTLMWPSSNNQHHSLFLCECLACLCIMWIGSWYLNDIVLDTFARSSHQSTGFLQSAGSKSLSKDMHGLPRNPSSSDVTDGAHKVIALLCCPANNVM